MPMVRYKQSTGNIKVTADKRIKYEVLDILTAMDICIIESIIHTRDNVVIEGDNRALTLITGLVFRTDCYVDYEHSDIVVKVNPEDIDTHILDEIARYYGENDRTRLEREILQVI